MSLFKKHEPEVEVEETTTSARTYHLQALSIWSILKAQTGSTNGKSNRRVLVSKSIFQRGWVDSCDGALSLTSSELVALIKLLTEVAKQEGWNE